MDSNSNNSDSPAPLSPFDPARLRLTQETVSVKRLITTIPVRKPAREWFVQVHPSEDYRLITTVLELKEDREVYLVDPSLRDELHMEACCSGRLLVTSVTRQGSLFLWPVRLPDSDGKLDDWNRSALAAVEQARDRWVRVTANLNLGAYEITQAVSADLAPPKWPGISFEEVLRVAFKGHHIASIDHPVLRKLRGEY